MKKLLLFCLLMFSTYSYGWTLFETNELSIDAIQVKDYRHSYWAEDKKAFTHGANFNLKLGIANNHLFWDNRVHLLGTDSQVRQGGWEYSIGAHLGKYFDAFYYHHSMHVMEREREKREYPLENMYVIRMYFYRGGK